LQWPRIGVKRLFDNDFARVLERFRVIPKTPSDGLKIPGPKGRVGSIPAPGTTLRDAKRGCRLRSSVSRPSPLRASVFEGDPRPRHSPPCVRFVPRAVLRRSRVGAARLAFLAPFAVGAVVVSHCATVATVVGVSSVRICSSMAWACS
jgi:hypothetical protein